MELIPIIQPRALTGAQVPILLTDLARELKFLEKVHFPPPVMCHRSCVTFHMSRVTCPVSHVTSHKVVKLVGGGSDIDGATPSGLFYWCSYLLVCLYSCLLVNLLAYNLYI